MSVRFKNARVEKMPLNIRIQWNAGTACVSECVLKTLACRGLRVGPPKQVSGVTQMFRTRSTTTRDRNLQFRGAVSTGGSPLDFLLFLPFLCAI